MEKGGEIFIFHSIHGNLAPYVLASAYLEYHTRREWALTHHLSLLCFIDDGVDAAVASGEVLLCLF